MFEFQTRHPGVGHRHEHVADDLIRGIAKGLLRPGDKLPTQKKLAESYSCGLGVVQKAAGRLTERRMIGVIKRSAGTMVLPGATQIAQQYLRERDRTEDIEVAKPSGSYARDEPARSMLALTPGAELSFRRPTAAELSAGTYDADELVADVTFPDATTGSYGLFRTAIKIPA